MLSLLWLNKDMQPQQPYYDPPQPPVVQPNYDFITNPGQPRRAPVLGGNSMRTRVLIVAVGLIILIIAFTIVKGLLTGGGNKAAMLVVAQDQQALIHLSTGASTQTAISTSNKNSATTTKAVLTSQQSQLLIYLKKQKQSVPEAKLGLKISSRVDKQLADALASSTYDTTYHDVVKSQLTDYGLAIQAAYKVTPGPIARKLLDAEYNSAVLLQKQLD